MGWLAVLALVHPAVLLARPRRRAVLAVVLATGLVTFVGALGTVLYPPYRNTLKQRLFVQSPSIGWLFERKEHLAVGAIALAWVGCVAHLSVSWFPDPARDRVARAAHVSFVLAAMLATATAVLGVIVSVHTTF